MKRFFIILLAAFCISSVSAQCTSPTANEAKGKVTKISQEQFQKKVWDYQKPDSLFTGATPIIVDCYADWCGPCKRLAPIVDELATEYKGKVIFYKVNVDDAKELARSLNIASIPTLLFFKDGQPVQRIVGLADKSNLKKAIDEYMLGE